MKMNTNYQARRLLAILILMFLLPLLISVMIKKGNDVVIRGIDNEFARQDAILQEHKELWGVKK